MLQSKYANELKVDKANVVILLILQSKCVRNDIFATVILFTLRLLQSIYVRDWQYIVHVTSANEVDANEVDANEVDANEVEGITTVPP